MKTKQELVDWIELRQKELISIDYDLIDSLNEPEIDSSIRSLRQHLHTVESNFNTIKTLVKSSKVS